MDVELIRSLRKALSMLGVPERYKSVILLDVMLQTPPGHELWRFVGLLSELGYSKNVVLRVLEESGALG